MRNEEKNNRHTVLKSVVGTLDLMIGHLSHGEDFPGVFWCTLNKKIAVIFYFKDLKVFCSTGKGECPSFLQH